MKSKNCEKQDNSTDLRPSQRRRLPSGHKVLNWRWYFFGWHNQSVVWCHPLVIVCLRPTCHHRPVHGHSFYCPFLPNYLSARWWHLNSRTKANGSRGPSFASINEFCRQRHLIAFNRSLNSIYWVHLGSTSSFHESQNPSFRSFAAKCIVWSCCSWDAEPFKSRVDWNFPFNLYTKATMNNIFIS